jgi:hypothetical protein
MMKKTATGGTGSQACGVSEVWVGTAATWGVGMGGEPRREPLFGGESGDSPNAATWAE